MLRQCRVCDVILTDDNTYPRPQSRNICKKCHSADTTRRYLLKYRTDPDFREKRKEQIKAYYNSHKKSKERKKLEGTWQQRNRDRFNAYMRDYHRKHILSINGKNVNVEKRPRPEACEVCKRPFKKLSWHHWDDVHPERGIWACMFCHIIAETVDCIDEKQTAGEYSRRVDSYRELKSSL